MFLAPAAMFAMFFYLSQYIQNVMGYSPIEAGVAFLPFCVGLVAAAGISSNLINRIDPRYLAGVGTLLAAAGAVRVLPAALRHHASRCSRRPGQLRHRPAAVHPADVVRHGADLRAAHADRGAPPARRGLRHRLGRAEHHAAGRRRARPGAARRRSPPRRSPTGSRDRQRPGRGGTGRAGGSSGDRQHQVFTEGATDAFLLGAA